MSCELRVVTFTNVEVERSASCGGCLLLCCWKKTGNGTEPGDRKLKIEIEIPAIIHKMHHKN